MKKTLCLVFALFLVVTLIFSYKVQADNKILFINGDEIELESDILLNLDLSSIEYNKFNVKIYSSEDIENVEQNNIADLEVENNEFEFNYDKNSSSINNVIFDIKLNNDINVGTKVNFKVIVTNNENDSESIEETVSSKIVEKKKESNNSDDSNNKSNNGNQNQNNKSYSYSSKSNYNNNNNSLSSFSAVNNSNVKINNAVYNGTSNNYLKKLSVKNYSFSNEFMKEVNTYFINVSSSVSKINVIAKAESSSATVNVSGNTGLKSGINKVLISVTAKNGSVRYYRIYVIKDSK